MGPSSLFRSRNASGSVALHASLMRISWPSAHLGAGLVGIPHDPVRRAVRSRHHLPRRRPACDLDDAGDASRAPTSWSSARRSTAAPPTGPGTRFGPQAIRMTDYLPHDGSRPHLALRDRRPAGPRACSTRVTSRCRRATSRSRSPALEAAVEKVARAGAIPVVLGGDHSIALPRRQGRGHVPRPRPGVDDPLRRARRHRRHRVRLAVGPRPADAPADRVRRAARRPVPPDRAARLLARTRDAGLDGRAADAVLRDDRDRAAAGSTRASTEAFEIATRRVRRRLPLRRHRRLRPRPRARHRHPRARRAVGARAARRRTPDLPRAARRRHRRGRGQSPPYDHADITAALANRVCLEALSAIAVRRRGIDHDPAGPLLEGR